MHSSTAFTEYFSFPDYICCFCPLGLIAEVHLDTLKQKGAIKRTLFLDNNQSHLIFPLTIQRQKPLHCQNFVVYLRVSDPESPFWPPNVQTQIPPFFHCWTILLVHIDPRLFSFYRKKLYYKGHTLHFWAFLPLTKQRVAIHSQGFSLFCAPAWK